MIVDNTNLKARDRQIYLDAARVTGAGRVSFRIIGGFTPEDVVICHARGLHGVPLEGLQRMAREAEIPAQSQEAKDQDLHFPSYMW